MKSFAVKSCVPFVTVVATVTLVSLALLSAVATTGRWYSQDGRQLMPWRDALEMVASPSTVDAMEQDELLRRRYLEIVELTTDLSKKVAARYQLPDLIRASESLDAYSEQLRSTQLRTRVTQPGLVRRLFGFGDDPPATNSSGTTDSGLADLFAPIANAFSSIGDSIMKDLTGSAMFFGIGLGSGAAQGLKLATPNTTQAIGAKVAADNGQQATGLNPAIENFGLGLSGSLLGAVNLSSLAGGGGGAGATSLGPLMRSLAEGLGNGTVSGLKLSAVDVEPPNGSTIPDAAGNFGYGLSKSLASNINVTAVVGAMPPMDFGRVAQGFARGLVQGAGDAVTSIGGVSALMNGTAHAPKVPLPDSTLAFNDSVGGAATGFGEGLGGQAVLVGRQLLSGFKTVTPGATSKRGLLLLDPRSVVVQRQSSSSSSSPSVVMVNGTSGFNLSVIINANTVSTAAQLGVNALTCQGVGGLMGVVLGLVNSGTIPTDQLSNNGNASDLVKQIVPTGIIRVTNAGNTYEVDGQQVLNGKGSLTAAAGGITINGHGAMTFIWFLLLHIILAIIAFLNVLPLAIGLESARNIVERLNFGHVLPNASRWTSILWFIFMIPLLVLVLAFGALIVGNAAHFRTAHGILGLVTVLLGALAIGLHFLVKCRGSTADFSGHSRTPLETVRAVVNHVFLVLAVAATITGFLDLSTVSLCFTQIIPMELSVLIGFGLAGVFTIGLSASCLDFYLSWRSRRKGQVVRGSLVREKAQIIVP